MNKHASAPPAAVAASGREPRPADDAAIAGEFYRIGDQAFGGWVRDATRPDQRFVVEIRLDGEHAALTLAESFVPELRQRFGDDGCHGFVVLLEGARIADASRAEAFIANSERRIGAVALEPGAEPAPIVTGRVAGELRWAGGLRLSGWACDVAAPSQPLAIEVMVDGETIAHALPTRWRESQAGDVVPSGRFAYDSSLPPRFADGRVHTVRVLAGGIELAGSPTLVLVHELGFQGLAAELDHEDRTGHLLRTQLLDRLMPGSLPLADFPAWQARFPVEAPAPCRATIAVLIVGDGEAALGATLDSLERQEHSGWFAVSLVAEEAAFAPEALAAAAAEIASGGADGVLVVEVGTILDSQAVGHVAAALWDAAAPGLVYADALVPGPGGRLVPSFKPAFDPVRMLAQAHMADLFALAPATFEAAVEEGCGSLYALLLAAVRQAQGMKQPIGHLPHLLASLPPRDLSRRSELLAGALNGSSLRERRASPQPGPVHPAVSLAWPAQARAAPVSIVIPTRDRVDLLRPCIESLMRRTERIAFEVIVVDNGSREPETLAYFETLRGLGCRVLPADIPFNYSRLNNLAVAEARHDLVLLLNNDVEIIEEGWLREMALELEDPATGIVGATLLWPSRLVQHGGVVLGPHFAAAHAFNDRLDGEGGYDDQLLVPRSQSAVTAACLLIRRSDYQAVGGLDELAFPVAFNDVDLCLKIRARGQSVVVTPRARLLHKESASRGDDHLTHEKRARSRKELLALRERWAGVLAEDPFYNPNLSLDLYPFSGLATPPRRRQLRLSST
jgi:O-antigen biosynthesis protein